MKSLIQILFGAGIVLAVFGLATVAGLIGAIRYTAATPTPGGTPIGYLHVEVDWLQTKTLWPILGQRLTDSPTLTYPEDRYIIGWNPWIGLNRGCVMEGHCILVVDGVGLFIRGPHKEAPDKIYDMTQGEFFPAGCGRFVAAGQQVSIQFLASNTGSAPGTNAATANARVFSIKAVK